MNAIISVDQTVRMIDSIQSLVLKAYCMTLLPTMPATDHSQKAPAMCGIVGAVSTRNIVPILDRRPEAPGIPRLRLLRRGRAPGRPAASARAAPRAWPSWKPACARTASTRGTGIAHTRWATHGAPEVHNAHPHFSRNRIALVHNGIIENHDELRAELQSRGYEFTSQTDTEVIAHLVDHLYDGDLFDAV